MPYTVPCTSSVGVVQLRCQVYILAWTPAHYLSLYSSLTSELYSTFWLTYWSCYGLLFLTMDWLETYLVSTNYGNHLADAVVSFFGRRA